MSPHLPVPARASWPFRHRGFRRLTANWRQMAFASANALVLRGTPQRRAQDERKIASCHFFKIIALGQNVRNMFILFLKGKDDGLRVSVPSIITRAFRCGIHNDHFVSYISHRGDGAYKILSNAWYINFSFYLGQYDLYTLQFLKGFLVMGIAIHLPARPLPLIDPTRHSVFFTASTDFGFRVLRQ